MVVLLFFGGIVMNLFRATILFRDFSFVYSFQKKYGNTIWDAFLIRLESHFNNCSIEKRSSMQSNYYLCSDLSLDDINNKLESLLREVISEDTKDYLVSVRIVSDEEAKKLIDHNAGGINEFKWFREYAEKKQLTREQRITIPEHKLIQQNDSSEKSLTETEAHTTNEDNDNNSDIAHDLCDNSLTLSQEIDKILRHKRALLNKVKGQRHAVEEVLNTVFECDAFASKNENREGPLASFLFTGPSGVGKTFLAKQCGKLLGRACKIIDMSEYSDNLAHGKFNGDYNHRAEVTSFIRENPNAIIVFDEIEKAHINTIHLFLQILDEGHLTDVKLNKKISFKDSIIIITTNAGRSLYDDTTVYDLSNIPRRVILEALRKDVNAQTQEPYFPDCIVTRFANGHVVLFNHLEPYALMDIVKEEITLQIELFQKSYGIKVNYDSSTISALIMYVGGGVSDARTLRGIARQIIVKELQDCVIQTYKQIGNNVNNVKNIELCIDIDLNESEVSRLFAKSEITTVAVFCNEETASQLSSVNVSNMQFVVCTDVGSFKKSARSMIDLALIDPTVGQRAMKFTPHDIEDIKSDGTDMFSYFFTHFNETSTYILDTKGYDEQAFDSLLAKGARGIVSFSNKELFIKSMKDIGFHSHINNAVFSLGRSGKTLTYNSYQYNVDNETVVIMFSRLALGFAKSADDTNILISHDKDNGITFDDIVGCNSAKDALREFCGFVSNPKSYIAKGRHIPKGVLLYGPPGTGKTMLAKAMANEANVAFLPVTATSFFGPLVGESERNIREIFRKARKYAPSIIFIDEVDAIARRRTGSDTTSHYENALNAFIAEMEGFSTDEKRPVFIMAATNYDVAGSDGKVLDPAFVRRFDKKIFVDLPDKDARYQFFKIKLKHHEIDFGEAHERVLDNLAQRTSGSSNADLEKIVEMFINTIDDTPPSSTVLMDMIDAFRFGDVNKITDERLRQTACHESGHALVNRLLGSTPLYLTVVSRGSFGGYMEKQHDEDALYYSYEQLMNMVCCALAGRVAEIEVYGKQSGLNTGASSDIDHARRYIKAALDDYAMGENIYSKSDEKTGEQIMKEQYDKTVDLISKHRSSLDKLTHLLVKHKSLDQLQLETFFVSEGI